MNKKQTATVVSYAVSAVLVLFGLIYTGFSIEIVTCAAVVGVFMIFTAVRANRNKKLNIIEQDELTKLIALKSYRNSWLVTIGIIFIFSWINFLRSWKPSFEILTTYLLIGMLLSFHISRFVYQHRLEAE